MNTIENEIHPTSIKKIGLYTKAAIIISLAIAGCLTPTGKEASADRGASKWEYAIGTEADGAPRVEPGTPIEKLKMLPDFYQTPKMPFIVRPGEQVIPVTIETCSGTEAQKILDDERKFVPEGVFVVRIDGVITISDTPLAPGKNTCLIFTEKGKIVAAPGSRTKELVLIKDTELVSFSSIDGVRGAIDGAGTDVTGIRVENGGKVHLDRLAISNCGGDGVLIAGRGDDDYANPASLTRSKVVNCRKNGVKVSRSPQFIALDNIITGNGGSGLEIDSPSAIIGNNISAGNDVGLRILPRRSTTITRNQLIGNRTGLDIGQESDFALVYENTIQDNELGAGISGMNTTIAWNIFAANRRQVKAGGKGNLLQNNTGLTVQDAGPGVAYFNPPTMSDQHREELIWKGEGDDDVAMGRYDFAVESGREPMNAAQVTERLKKMREAHPDKVLVARLTGSFVVRTDDGLKIPDHTCVLLEGTISNEASEKQRPYLVSIKGKGCVSLSGGKINSETSVFSAVAATKARNTALIDGVHINLNSLHGHVGSKSINAISAKQHNGGFMMRRCEIRNPGSRGIWAHVSKRIYILGNRFYAGGMTIDFDAFCFESAALYNTVTGGTYHSGIFFEEGVNYNTAFANRLYKNTASAIQIWTQATKLNTEKNLIACNEIVGGARDEFGSGFSVGANTDDPLKKADNNYIFNNRFDGCNGRAAIIIKKGASNNYFGQNVLGNNKTMIINWSKGTTHDFAPQTGFTSPAP